MRAFLLEPPQRLTLRDIDETLGLTDTCIALVLGQITAMPPAWVKRQIEILQ